MVIIVNEPTLTYYFKDSFDGAAGTTITQHSPIVGTWASAQTADFWYMAGFPSLSGSGSVINVNAPVGSWAITAPFSIPVTRSIDVTTTFSGGTTPQANFILTLANAVDDTKKINIAFRKATDYYYINIGNGAVYIPDTTVPVLGMNILTMRINQSDMTFSLVFNDAVVRSIPLSNLSFGPDVVFDGSTVLKLEPSGDFEFHDIEVVDYVSPPPPPPPPPPPSEFLDEFDGPAGTPITSHTPDIGSWAAASVDDLPYKAGFPSLSGNGSVIHVASAANSWADTGMFKIDGQIAEATVEFSVGATTRAKLDLWFASADWGASVGVTFDRDTNGVSRVQAFNRFNTAPNPTVQVLPLNKLSVRINKTTSTITAIFNGAEVSSVPFSNPAYGPNDVLTNGSLLELSPYGDFEITRLAAAAYVPPAGEEPYGTPSTKVRASKIRVTALTDIPDGTVMIEKGPNRSWGFFDGSNIRNAPFPSIQSLASAGAFGGDDSVPGAWLSSGGVPAGYVQEFTIPEISARKIIFKSPLVGTSYAAKFEALDSDGAIIGRIKTTDGAPDGTCTLNFTHIRKDVVSVMELRVSTSGVPAGVERAIIKYSTNSDSGFFSGGEKVYPIPFPVQNYSQSNYPNEIKASYGSSPTIINGQEALLYVNESVSEGQEEKIYQMGNANYSTNIVQPVLADEIRIPIGDISGIDAVTIAIHGYADEVFGLVTVGPEHSNTVVRVPLSYDANVHTYLREVTESTTITFDESPSNGEAFKVILPPKSMVTVSPHSDFMNPVCMFVNTRGYYERYDPMGYAGTPVGSPITFENQTPSPSTVCVILADDGAPTFWGILIWRSPVPMSTGSVDVTIAPLDVGAPTDAEDITTSYYSKIVKASYDVNRNMCKWYRLSLDQATAGVKFEVLAETASASIVSMAIYLADGTLLKTVPTTYSGDAAVLSRTVEDLDPGVYYIGVSGEDAFWPEFFFPKPSNGDYSGYLYDVSFRVVIPQHIQVYQSHTNSILSGFDSNTFVLSRPERSYDSTFKCRFVNHDGTSVRIKSTLAPPGFADPAIHGGFRDGVTFYDTIVLDQKGQWVDVVYDSVTGSFQVVASNLGVVGKWVGGVSIVATNYSDYRSMSITSEFGDGYNLNYLGLSNILKAFDGLADPASAMVTIDYNGGEPKLKTVTPSGIFAVTITAQIKMYQTYADTATDALRSNELGWVLRLDNNPDSRDVLFGFGDVPSAQVNSYFGRDPILTVTAFGYVETIQGDTWCLDFSSQLEAEVVGINIHIEEVKDMAVVNSPAPMV